tara:strand:- start:362 stop:1369 length:1008 start_codon:yes stop_codon:yes gene_type:complete
MSIDKLREIVGSGNAETPDKSDTFGQAQINKSEDWLLTHSNLNNKDMTSEWLKEFSNWGFTSNNTDYYWDTLEKISPMESKEFQDFTTKDIRKTIDRMSTMEDKENYFRDNAATWPGYVLENLGGYFTNIRGANAGKELERNRMTQIMEIKDMLRNKKFSLDPNVSIEAHSEEMVKAYDMGYRGEIETDESGRLSVPLDGKRVPVYTLQNPELSMEEEFISLNDLRGVVKDRFKPMLKESRSEQNMIERKTKKALFNRIKKGEIPKEFRSNVIIDGSLEERDPAKAATTAILESVKYNDENGMYSTTKDMFLDYKNQYEDLLSKLSRRLNDGKYS